MRAISFRSLKFNSPQWPIFLISFLSFPLLIYTETTSFKLRGFDIVQMRSKKGAEWATLNIQD